jgi:GNAT superfamily N-acetyltransferase
MTLLQMRRARADDVGDILRLIADNDVARARGDYALAPTPETLAAFEEIAASADHELWVGEVDGRVAATAQLTVMPGLSRGGMKRAIVESVHVRADLRGRGYGRQLMQAMIERARERGARMLQLTSDRRRTEAHRFYESLGFEASHVGMKRRL